MNEPIHDSDLEAYLDEALSAVAMAAVEEALRRRADVRERLTIVRGRRDAGVHSLGAIWRRERLSCPTRDQLGSYLLGALGDSLADYIRFHVEDIGCPFCQANLADLESLTQQQGGVSSDSRRSKYFQSSAGLLRRR